MVGILPTPFAEVPGVEAQSASLVVTGDDYATAREKIFGSGAYAYVVLTNPTATGFTPTEQIDVFPGVTVKSATSDPSPGITIDLLETGPETNIYRGGFGFAPAPTASNPPGSHPFLGAVGVTGAADAPGRIKVAAGETVTVEGGGQTDTFVWSASATATLVATNENLDPAFTQVLGAEDSIIFTITDSDLNQDTSKAETYSDLLFVSTDSDPEGVFLTLTEKEANSVAGEFSATAEFRSPAGGSTNPNALFVLDSDKIRARYTEPRDDAGDRKVRSFPEWTFREVTTGQVLFNRMGYTGETSATSDNGRDRAVITVVDADPNTSSGAEPVTVSVLARKLDGTPRAAAMNVQLTELSGSAVGSITNFVGTLGFAKDGSCPNEVTLVHCLTVDDGDTIEASYVDQNIPAKAVWRNAVDAVIDVGAPGTDRLFGTAPTVQIELRDADSNDDPNNRNQVTVHAKSTSDPTSLSLTLLETGSNTGRFTGTFRFTATSESGRLKVADRDLVTVEYLDPVGADGKPKLVRANGGGYIVWRSESPATITTDQTDYYRLGAANAIQTIAHIYISDEDQNNPLKRDFIDVQAVTAETFEVVTLRLRELGLDSGMFYGQLRFSQTTSTGGTCDSLVVDCFLNVGTVAKREFSIQYAQRTSSGSTSPPQSPTLNFWNRPSQETQSVLRFEDVRTVDGKRITERADQYWVNATGTPQRKDREIRVVLYASPQFDETVTATLTSTICTATDGHQRQVQLKDNNDDGAVDGRYVGVFTIRRVTAADGNNDDPNTCQDPEDASTYLGVELDKTFRATVNLPTAGGTLSATGTAKELKDEGVAFTDKAGAAVERTSGLAKPVWLRLSGWMHNTDSTRREFHVQEVYGTSVPANKTKMLLLETEPNSGIFHTSFAFAETNALNAADRATEHRVEVPKDLKIRISGAQATFNAAKPGYGIHGGAQVQTLLSTDTLGWFPATDATLEVTREAFGSTSVEVALTDGDGMGPRIFEKKKTEGSTRAYDFATKPYVQGSELIYVGKSHPQAACSSTPQQCASSPFTATPPFATKEPAERISDVNLDGKVDCRDVTVTGSRDPAIGDTTPVAAKCTGVDPVAGKITFVFQDLYGATTCTPQPNVVQCTGTVTFVYRPFLVSSCPPPPENAALPGQRSPHEYIRRADGISLCWQATQNMDLYLMYQPFDRTITVRSFTERSAPSHLEQFTTTLSFDAGDSSETDNRWVFTGNIPVETTAAANKNIHVTGTSSIIDFHYIDPTQTFDGGVGSDVRNHFRTNMVSGKWRSAESAILRVMAANFSNEAGSPVFGPAVPVLVEDKDSDRSPAMDTIKVTVRDGNNRDASFTLTLREDGVQSGKFRGIIPVNDEIPGQGPLPASTLNLGCPTTNPDCSQILIVSYADPFGANGQSVTRSVNKDWRPAAEADVDIFTDSEHADPATIANPVKGNNGRLHVRVTDPDANKAAANLDTIEINVISDSDPVGEMITLSETTVNSGVFTGSVAFQRELIGNDDKVFTRDIGLFEDQVTVKYEDLQDDLGNRRVVTPVEQTGWDEQSDGTVVIGLPFYKGTDATPAGVAAGDLARATILVLDGDGNGNAKKVDTITLTDDDNFRLGQVGSTGAFLTGKRTTIIRLVETGANTGEFLGVVSFTTAAAGVPEALPPPPAPATMAKVPMSNAKEWKFEYIDDTPAASSIPQSFSDTAAWYIREFGVVTFDREGYNSESIEPKVRLYDVIDGDPSSVQLTVTSDTDATGKSITVNKVRPGFFQSSFKISTTGATDAIAVSKPTDLLRVRYTDASPAGQRAATANVAIGDFDAPETSLVTTPVVPDGANGWFITRPTIVLEADEPVTSTFYTLDGGSQLLFNSGFNVEEGAHTIEFWSVDTQGNVEERQTATVNWDATAPAKEVAGLKATPGRGGTIVLSWDPVTGKTNPLEFGFYQIYQTSTSNKIGNATTETFTAATTTDGSHTFLVGVADMAGNVDLTRVKSISAVSDSVAPRLEGATVSPTELIEAVDTDLTATITARVVTSDLGDLDRVEVTVLEPRGPVVDNFTLTREGSTNVFRGSFSDFEVSGPYVFNVDALDAAGNFARQNLTVFFRAIDRFPPLVELPETVERGTPLAVTVKDNDAGIASIAYSLDGGPESTVAVTGGPLTHTFTVATGGLSLGTHTIRLTVSDLNQTANFATYTETFEVVLEGSQPPIGGNQPPLVSPTSTLVQLGGTLRVSVQSGGPLTALTVAFDGGAPASILSSWALGAASVPIEVGDLAAGAHTAQVVATNAQGTTTETVSFFVLDAGIPLPPSGVVVVKTADGPKISWQPSTGAGGYLVHRAASPWKVIAVLGPEKTSFTDTTADEGKTYSYAVTAYGPNGEGKLDKGDDSQNELPWFTHLETKSFKVGEPDSNFWTIFWVTLILLAVIGAVVLAYVNRQKLFPPKEEGYAEEEYPDEAAAAGPFAVERHELRCPNCATRFSVTGQKPIVTTCPNCGKKGILR